MGTPNEYMPSALYGYPQNEVTPYTHQATQSAANFAQFANNGTAAYFNNGGFFPNSLNHNSLPAFHANSARASYASTFVQGEPQSGTAMNMYNANTTQNMAYWSQQPQLSPFGVLPHEIAADHLVDQPPMYNNAQSVHYVAPHSSLNTGNVTTPNNIFPSLHAPVMKYTDEQQSRQFAMNNGTQSQINNRLPTGSTLVQSQVSEFRDRNRSTPFVPPQSKLEFHLSGHPTSVIQKNRAEYRDSSRSSPLVQQNMSEYRTGDNSRASPLVQQKVSEFRDNSRSSPLVQQKISEFRDNSRSSPHVVAHSGSCESPFLNRNNANTVPHASLPLVYGDTTNVVRRNVDENRVTSPYLQLPHAAPAAVNSSSANATEVGRVNQSLYAAYNNKATTNTCTVDLQRREPKTEKSSRSTLGSACHVEQRSNFPIKMTEVGDSSNRPNVVMSTKTTLTNNRPVEYPPCTSERDSYFRKSSCAVSAAEIFEAREKTPPQRPVFEQGAHQYQYNPQPTISLLPSNESAVEPSPPARKTSTSDATIRQHLNNVVKYDDSPTFSNTCSEPERTDFQQQSHPPDNASSVENVPYGAPSQSKTALETSQTTSETMSPWSLPVPLSPAQCSSSQSTLAEFIDTGPDYIVAREEMVGNIRVIVPDIEAEFKFLFDSQLPHYDEIVGDEEQIRTDCLPTYCRKNVDFLGCYIQFLEDSGENVEKLKASHANEMKRWVAAAVSIGGADGETSASTPPARKESKSMTEEEDHDFDNDPRYYPLQKTSDQRRLADTSDEEDDEIARTASQSGAKSKLKSNKEEDHVGCRNYVQEVQSREAGSVRKKKRKRDGEKRSKSKWRRMSNDVELSEQSGRETPEYSERFARKVTLRRANVSVQEKIKKAVETDDDESANSDPSWSPRDDDEDESYSLRKSSRTVRSRRKSSESNSSARKDVKNGIAKGRNREWSDSETDDDVGSFFVQKNQIDSKKHPLWRLHGERLQKFEPRKKDGKRIFSSVSQYVNLSNSRLNKYEKVEVHILHRSKGCLIVELQDDMDSLTDEKVRDNFMSEALCYESHFTVYVQTLLSQALDSNFLEEIVRENDNYFLENVKVIEDVTANYLNEFSSLVKCASKTVDLLMKTWPNVSIETRNSDSYRDGEGVCACCGQANATKTAIFYGQTYKRETLQGSTTNIPNNIDKTANLCKGCAKKIQLFNKIWHQKYHLFVECAKCVSKKRTLNKNKVTTDILNESLADNLWLDKLFYDIRNTWLKVWTMVQKTRKKVCSGSDDASSCL